MDKPMDRTELTFCPEDLDGLADDVHKLRIGILCDVEDAGADPYAKQAFLLALSALEQARIYLRLAALHQARELCGKSRR